MPLNSNKAFIGVDCKKPNRKPIKKANCVLINLVESQATKTHIPASDLEAGHYCSPAHLAHGHLKATALISVTREFPF